MKHYYALILAGGGGTRLWPMSRKETPKQLLPLVGDSTMYRTSVDRLSPLFPKENIYISTTQQHVDGLKAESPDIPEANYIVEPSARNNAAAVGLAIQIIYQRDPNAVIAMLTADHHIAKQDKFRDVLEASYHLAERGKIVTLGIAPTFPSTGFGYIEQGESEGEQGDFEYFAAERFTEKPSLVTATRFLSSGRYSWNSGMFIWQAATAMQEFERQQSEMYQLLQQLAPTVDTPQFKSTLNRIWDDMPQVSIDYAIMEDAANMVVIPVEIGWSDVGAWSSLYDLLSLDQFGNCGKNDEHQRIAINTHNTLTFTDKLTVTIGIDDIIVVETDDALLICHRDRAQDVKEVVQYLRDNNMDSYL